MDVDDAVIPPEDAVLAPGGWRRGVIGLALGALYGLLVHRVTRGDDSRSVT